VSRYHANIGRRSDGWWFVDHSNSGSFIDGERVKEKKFTEQTVVQLGHPDAGYQLTLGAGGRRRIGSEGDRRQAATQNGHALGGRGRGGGGSRRRGRRDGAVDRWDYARRHAERCQPGAGEASQRADHRARRQRPS